MSDVLFGQSYYLRFDPKLWKRDSHIRHWVACTPLPTFVKMAMMWPFMMP